MLASGVFSWTKSVFGAVWRSGRSADPFLPSLAFLSGGWLCCSRLHAFSAAWDFAQLSTANHECRRFLQPAGICFFKFEDLWRLLSSAGCFPDMALFRAIPGVALRLSGAALFACHLRFQLLYLLCIFDWMVVLFSLLGVFLWVVALRCAQLALCASLITLTSRWTALTWASYRLWSLPPGFSLFWHFLGGP